MAGAVGREIVAAFKKYGTWRTVSGAPGAGDGLLLRNLGGQPRNPDYYKSDEAGLAFITRADKGGVKAITEDLTAYARYEGLDVLLALAMGTAGVPVSAGSGAYYNTYSLATRLDDLFGSLFVKHTVASATDKVWAYTSTKITGFTITSRAGQPVEISFARVSNDCDIDSAVSMASVTVPSLSNRLMGQEATVRMNAQSGSALAAPTDVIQPNEWTLTYKRPVDSVHVMDGDATIIEPVESGFPELTLTMNFPRYNTANHAFFTALGADTRQKCDITFLGALIGGANYNTFRLRFPHLNLITGAAPKDSASIVPVNLTFEVLGATTAPSGMTALTKPFDMYVMNTRSVDPLA